MVRTMLEYSSISVSSYDAASLADRLTEKSAQGWDVVTIVSAGTNVTAYLSRAAGTTDAQSVESPTDTDDDRVSFSTAGDTATDAPAAAAAEPEVSAAESALAAAQPVSEPAGWASEPEPAPAAAWQPTDESFTPSDLAPTPEPEPEPDPEPEPAQAAAAPAGWYADPAGRFELRYWDGSQWTEHVSRAGQQFTDPPVA
jgi:hypothetical protein